MRIFQRLREKASGSQVPWATEKYKGAALLQKKSTVGFLTKTMKKNKGEVHHYFIEHSRPAIIDPLEFNLVQNEIARRKTLGRKYSGDSVVSAESYAATAVNISVQRYGTQTANIELLSGNATLNLTAIKSAKRRTIRKPN